MSVLTEDWGGRGGGETNGSLPLSPLLFILSLEVTACSVRQSDKFKVSKLRTKK